jgi:glycosyltransferase involved in cell wall biosynthesis
MKVEIAIPVLNEENTIQAQIKKILTYINDNLREEFEVSLVIGDNGSTDRTSVLVKEMLPQYRNLKYVYVSKPGVGMVLKKIWTESESKIVGYMDLDTATDLKHLSEALNIISNNHDIDILYGTRLHKNSIVKNRPIRRKITSKVLNFILKKYLKIGFSDGMCGFKFLKQKYVKELIENGADSDGWFFCTEILVVGEWSNLQLWELPVHWVDDRNSKVKTLKLTIEYLKAMKKLKDRCKIKK